MRVTLVDPDNPSSGEVRRVDLPMEEAGGLIELNGRTWRVWTGIERLFENMRAPEGRRMFPPEGAPSIPLMFGVAAVRPN